MFAVQKLFSADDLTTGQASVEGWAYAVGDDFLSHVNETAQGSIEQERIHEALGYVCVSSVWLIRAAATE